MDETICADRTCVDPNAEIDRERAALLFSRWPYVVFDSNVEIQRLFQTVDGAIRWFKTKPSGWHLSRVWLDEHGDIQTALLSERPYGIRREVEDLAALLNAKEEDMSDISELDYDDEPTLLEQGAVQDDNGVDSSESAKCEDKEPITVRMDDLEPRFVTEVPHVVEAGL